MIALCIIGGLLQLLLILLLIPIQAEIRFQGEFFLTLHYLFLRVPVIPVEDKKEGEEEKTVEEEAEKEEESILQKLKRILQKKGFSGFLSALKEFVMLAKDALSKILVHVRIREFDLYVSVGGAEDAAAAAILYGEACSVVYPACEFLLFRKRCRNQGVTVDLNYATKENLLGFSGKVSILPVFLLKEGLCILFGGISFLKKIRS